MKGESGPSYWVKFKSEKTRTHVAAVLVSVAVLGTMLDIVLYGFSVSSLILVIGTGGAGYAFAQHVRRKRSDGG